LHRQKEIKFQDRKNTIGIESGEIVNRKGKKVFR